MVKPCGELDGSSRRVGSLRWVWETSLDWGIW